MKKVIFFLLPFFFFIIPYIIAKISAKIILDNPLPPLQADLLRQKALKAGFCSIPTDTKKMLQLVNTSDNLLNSSKIELGRELYFDPSLSKDGTISCASCHDLDKGGDDGRSAAIGYKNQINPHHLNSPTVLNAALESFQFWDGRVKTVEEQAAGPIQAPFEMASTPKEVVQKVANNSRYKELFRKAFGDDTITFKRITQAIGAYERTLLTRSRFDSFLDSNLTALSKKEQRGLNLFIDVGCKACHFGLSIGGRIIQKFPMNSYNAPLYPIFGIHGSHYYFKGIVADTNVSNMPYPFPNLGHYYGKNDAQMFKVPILRNITKTAPYFHNGSVKNLKEVIRIMAKYQRGVELEKNQIDDIEAFLHSLEGEIVDYNFSAI